jgi:hypothetical protein
MEIDPLVQAEWREHRCLSRRSLIWIRDHADPGDPHPVATAIAELRSEHPRDQP